MLLALCPTTSFPELIAIASKTGVGIGALVNVYHFAALWPEVETIADSGMVGFAEQNARFSRKS